MKQKLIELLKNAVYDQAFTNSDGEFVMSIPKRIVDINEVEILADHLLENGVVVLPFPIGTTYYRIVTKRAKVGFPFHKIIRQSKLNWYNLDGVLSDFGKTVFLTKKEAEKTLAEELKKGE